MRSYNVIILAICQSLAMSAIPVLFLIAGIVGVDLAPAPSMATLPISLMVIGVATSTIPAAMLMRKVGRRIGFMTGASIAGAACLLACFSLLRASFSLFCVSAFFIGTNSAFIQQYRFAAVESVRPEMAGRAVSYVLVGGILAGYLGPELARYSRTWLVQADFSGSFLLMAGILVLVIILFSFLKTPTTAEEQVSGVERPLKQILEQPAFVSAVLIGTAGFGVMNFIMTATPIELHTLHHFSIDQTAWIIQSHIIAMYLPSLFTGFLIQRLGVVRVVLIGTACMLSCVAIGFISRELVHYWGALVLLGLGWNFMFIGSTVILTSSYLPAERFKAQAINDFTIFGVQACTSLSAAVVIFQSNWDTLVLLNLPALFLVVLLVFWYRRQSESETPLNFAD